MVTLKIVFQFESHLGKIKNIVKSGFKFLKEIKKYVNRDNLSWFKNKTIAFNNQKIKVRGIGNLTENCLILLNGSITII